MRLVLSLWWIALSRTSFACFMPRLCCANAVCPSKSNKSAKPFTDNVRVMQWRASNHLRGEFPLRPECNHICLSFYLKYSYIPKLLVGDSDEQAKAQVYQERLARTTLVALKRAVTPAVTSRAKCARAKHTSSADEAHPTSYKEGDRKSRRARSCVVNHVRLKTEAL